MRRGASLLALVLATLAALLPHGAHAAADTAGVPEKACRGVKGVGELCYVDSIHSEETYADCKGTAQCVLAVKRLGDAKAGRSWYTVVGVCKEDAPRPLFICAPPS